MEHDFRVCRLPPPNFRSQGNMEACEPMEVTDTVQCDSDHKYMTLGHVYCECERILPRVDQYPVVRDQIQRNARQKFEQLASSAFIFFKGRNGGRTCGSAPAQQEYGKAKRIPRHDLRMPQRFSGANTSRVLASQQVVAWGGWWVLVADVTGELSGVDLCTMFNVLRRGIHVGLLVASLPVAVQVVCTLRSPSDFCLLAETRPLCLTWCPAMHRWDEQENVLTRQQDWNARANT